MSDLEKLLGDVDREPGGGVDGRRLRRCIGRMPEAMRRAVTLRHVYGMRQAEIAARLQLSAPELEELLVGACRRLRQALDPDPLHVRAWQALEAAGVGLMRRICRRV